MSDDKHVFTTSRLTSGILLFYLIFSHDEIILKILVYYYRLRMMMLYQFTFSCHSFRRKLTDLIGIQVSVYNAEVLYCSF
jgi:hypothetical protein